MPLKALLLQLIPILIFVLVDALVKDFRWAIVSALVFVVGQAVVSYRRDHRLDRFLILDLLLIGGMSFTSLMTKNDLFFKLKPATLEFVLLIFTLFLSFASPTTTLRYFERYSLGRKINPQAINALRQLLVMMSILVFLHASLIVWAAFFWSRATWGIISGPGFYLILIPILLWTIFQRYKNTKGISSRTLK